VKRASIRFSELAVADILEQADWYEIQSGPKLATRWERAVTSTIVRISTAPKSGALCWFKAEQLSGSRRVSIAGFPKHLIFYQVDSKGIFELRVVHGARDLESLFSA